MNRKKFLYAVIGIILVVIAAYFLFSSNNKNQSLIVSVAKGKFNIEVTTTGELIAKNAEKIYGPDKLEQLGVWEIRIQHIVDEGTRVKADDYIATLDPKDINNQIKTAEDQFDEIRVKLEETRLDTSLTLKQQIDQIKDLEFDLEEARIAVKQSEYETDATKEKVRNDLKKAEKKLEQEKMKYKLELKRAESRMKTSNLQYNQRKKRLDDLKQILKDLTIKAPKPGMVIYHRNMDRTKNGIGATLRTYYDFVVAELPDLTRMISTTSVNEIDINKVRKGQNVTIGIDAFPDKKFTGQVTEVANMGEEDQKSNTKLFEIKILLNGTDSILRPGMTTKNTILTGIYDNVLQIPIEALYTDENSDTCVYKKVGSHVIKQQISCGPSNDNEIIIRAGLKENNEILLTEPPKSNELNMVYLPGRSKAKSGIKQTKR